ncbi:MAG: thiamine phosphate synthase, partial [Sulfuricellaceae bacterium]|nr:thiamine phosphate synthase [Sulfuricellaceae bacterium]
LARSAGADGVHLSGAQLVNLPARPEADWVGASCHTPEEMARAVELGVDFVLISPVLPTLTHPDAPALGWEAFARLNEDYPLPVYALGGMTRAKLETAWEHGAHGIAMMRDAWR